MKLKAINKVGILVGITGNIIILCNLYLNKTDMVILGILVTIIGLVLKHYDFFKNYFKEGLSNAFDKEDDVKHD
jgi:hypothetical protein